jgi:hypothetical protein
MITSRSDAASLWFDVLRWHRRSGKVLRIARRRLQVDGVATVFGTWRFNRDERSVTVIPRRARTGASSSKIGHASVRHSLLRCVRQNRDVGLAIDRLQPLALELAKAGATIRSPSTAIESLQALTGSITGGPRQH